MKTEHTSNLEYYHHTPLKGDKEWIVGVPNQPGTNLFKATATCFHKADARLYAAAPDLLAALQGILTSNPDLAEVADSARAAIAKATQ